MVLEMMTPEQEQALQEHIQAIAKILYDDTPPEQLTGLRQKLSPNVTQTGFIGSKQVTI